MPTRRSGGSHSFVSSERFNEVMGLLLIAVAVFLAVALWSFHPRDPSWAHRASAQWGIRNYGGTVGAYLAGGLVQLMGSFAALIPLMVFAWGIATFAGIRSWWPGWHGLGGLTIALSSAGLFHKAFLQDPLFGKETLAGGVVGYGVSAILGTALGRIGSWVVLLGALTAAVVATTGLSLAQFVGLVSQGPRWVGAKVIPPVWRAFSAISARGATIIYSLLRNQIKRGLAAWRVLLKRVSENLQELVAGSSQGPRISVEKYVDDPTSEYVGEKDPSDSERGGLATILAAGRQLALAGRSKIGSSERIRYEDEQRSPMVFSDTSTAEETAVSVLGGPAEEERLKEVRGPRKFRFRLRSGDKGAVEGQDASYSGGTKPSLDSPRQITVQKKPGGGIRIGRRKVQTLVPGIPVVRPSMESAPAEIEELAPLGRTSSVAPETVTPVSKVQETSPSGVRVRHAGLEGEAEIVRIEDDSIVSDMDVPEVMKSSSRRRSRYSLPSLDLFADAKSGALVVDEDLIREKSELLEKTLLEFGVEGHVTEVKTGPVITIYEFVPAAGVKVSKISSLSDDLARALSAINVRIVAPIPGTSVVGIEVPNAKRRTVHIKEILSSREFSQAQERLTLGIGKDILGRTAFTDLAKIPHLLIAGATGAGKSVALNMMICSLLVRCMPREVRLVMIDPKMLEFSIYEGVPHLLVPIITSPKKASSALRGVVAEMESRYSKMSALGVRNIDSYNRRVADRLGPKETNRLLSQHLSQEEPREGEMDFMPYIVVVIDELADLMMVSSRDVEENMTRLAQMARAAGIHLLVATQRPSVDVLTGLIKANFPSRLSLRVASRTDSRTILDMNGAERLLGKGDMLFIPPGTSTPTRIHGAYVSEQEIRNLVTYWREQGPTAFKEDIFVVEAESRSDDSNGDNEYDERYDDAVSLVARTGEASISLIQRHLRIGYNRAARMIERMEQEGIVGPSDGVKRRQVLIREIPDNDVDAAEDN